MSFPVAERVVTATEARVHLGELMRDIEDHQHVVVVHRAGKPQAVLLSIAEYSRLRQLETRGRPDWRELVARSRERIRRELKGQSLPPAEEIVRQGREERDAQILENLRLR